MGCTSHKQLFPYEQFDRSYNFIAAPNNHFRYQAIVKIETNDTTYKNRFGYFEVNEHLIQSKIPYKIISLDSNEVHSYDSILSKYIRRNKIRIYEAFYDSTRYTKVIYCHIFRRVKLEKYISFFNYSILYLGKVRRRPEEHHPKKNILFVQERQGEISIIRIRSGRPKRKHWNDYNFYGNSKKLNPFQKLRLILFGVRPYNY